MSAPDTTAEPDMCERCKGEGLVPAGVLPNGDVDMDVCDDCDGEGVAS